MNDPVSGAIVSVGADSVGEVKSIPFDPYHLSTFSFKDTTDDAPNPVLHVAQLGIVGLPLSERDAAAIKMQARPASLSTGGHATIAQPVIDAWEIDGQRCVLRAPSFIRTILYLSLGLV